MQWKLLWQIFWLFTKVAMFSWGGGAASLGLMQREVVSAGWLTPNEFASRPVLAERRERFERHYELIAKPFEWKFTREDLTKLMPRLQRQPQPVTALAA